MKLFLLVFLLLLSGCSRSVEVSYEEGSLISVYALENKSNKSSLVSIEYTLENEYQLFDLYTIHQNYLPEGYHSPGSPNITLLEVYVDQQEIYYVVDRYILLVNLQELKELMSQTARLLDYQDVHFILEQKIII